MYFHDQIVKDFEDDPKHRFQVIEPPSKHKKGVLRLELALVEIDPSIPVALTLRPF